MTKLPFNSDNTFIESAVLQKMVKGLHVPVCVITEWQEYVVSNQAFDDVMSKLNRQLPGKDINVAAQLGIEGRVWADVLTELPKEFVLETLSPTESIKLHISVVNPGEKNYYLLELQLTEVTGDSHFANSDTTIFEMIPMIPDCAILTRKSDGKILIANSIFLSVFGYSASELAGKTTVEAGIWPGKEQRDWWTKELNQHNYLSSYEAELFTKDHNAMVAVISSRVVEFQQEQCVLSITRDITLQKQNEIKIQKHEAALSTLINTIPDLVWLKDKEGVYLNCNYRFLDFAGKEKADLIGKTDYDLFSSELADFFRMNDLKAVEAGAPTRNDEWVSFATDGHKEFLETIKTPVYSTENQLYGVLGIGRDMTERYQSGLKLQKSEVLFKTVFEINPDVMTLTRLEDGVYRNVNSSFSRVLKYQADEIINYSSLEKNIWLDDAERNCLKEELTKNGVVYNKECRFIAKDKEIVYGLMSACVIDIDGEAHLLAITRPINELKAVQNALKESEANLKMLFSSMSEVVIMHELVLDEKGKAMDYRILDCNNSFDRISRIPAKDIIGRLGSDIFNTSSPPYLELYAKVIETGEPASFQSDSVPANRHILVSAVKVEANRFATISTDITELKHIEKELLEKNKELEKYLYIASHDLRSPMVNIQGFSQRMMRQTEELADLMGACCDKDGKIIELLSTEIPKSLRYILGGVAKMDSLINSLLTISRTGRQVLTIRKVDMNELCQKIIQTLDYEICECDAVITLKDMAVCEGDEMQLNQLFSNILANAIKYRDQCRPLQITIQSQQENDHVLYTIADNGIGIAEKNIDRIWDVFFRVDFTSGMTGEGIGLSLVKTIVNKHKGRVWVESEPGKGSTFMVELPLKQLITQDE